jgi:hypothetical protein
VGPHNLNLEEASNFKHLAHRLLAIVAASAIKASTWRADCDNSTFAYIVVNANGDYAASVKNGAEFVAYAFGRVVPVSDRPEDKSARVFVTQGSTQVWRCSDIRQVGGVRAQNCFLDTNASKGDLRYTYPLNVDGTTRCSFTQQ